MISGCEQMVTELTHIDGEVFDLGLTVVSDLVEVRIRSPLGMISNHSAVFIDVVLNQLIPHLVCRQEVYLNNLVD